MLRRYVLLCASILAFLFSMPVASAQCTRATNGFMNVGVVPNNPFRAELVTNNEGSLPFLASGSLLQKPQLIARDSQGRVRIERVAGKYKMDSGPDQGQELDQHLIYVCDPVSQTLTQIDTLNRTARITHFGHSIKLLPPTTTPATQSSICATKDRLVSIANSKSEDLGNQTILGLQAHGTRLILTPSIAPPEGHSVTTTIQDQWCSDDLDAIVLTSHSFVRDNKTFHKSETSLSKLERTEPDATLFQIPPDFTISEFVPNAPPRHPSLVPPVPNPSAGTTASPQH